MSSTPDPRRVTALALAAGLGLCAALAGGCQQHVRRERAPVSRKPIPTDEAMAHRDWETTSAYFARGSVRAGATRSNYQSYEDETAPTYLHTLTDPVAFVAQTAVLPFTYIWTPWGTPVTYRGNDFEPTYTAVPPLPGEGVIDTPAGDGDGAFEGARNEPGLDAGGDGAADEPGAEGDRFGGDHDGTDGGAVDDATDQLDTRPDAGEGRGTGDDIGGEGDVDLPSDTGDLPSETTADDANVGDSGTGTGTDGGGTDGGGDSGGAGGTGGGTGGGGAGGGGGGGAGGGG